MTTPRTSVASRTTDSAARAYLLLPPRARARVLRPPLRGIVLAAVFRVMPRRFDRARGAGITETVHWYVTGDGGTDAWQLRFEGTRCRVDHRLDREPTTTITLADRDLLDLVTGEVSGPLLFVRRRLRVSGDLAMAIRLPSLLRIPGTPPGI